MARLRAELESRLALLGGNREFGGLAALLHWADSRDAFTDCALWGGLCDFVEERSRTMGPCEPFATRYRQELDAGGEAALAPLALDDMREGRVLAALALLRMRVSRELPLWPRPPSAVMLTPGLATASRSSGSSRGRGLT